MKKKELIDIEFSERKADYKIMEIILTFDSCMNKEGKGKHC